MDETRNKCQYLALASFENSRMKRQVNIDDVMLIVIAAATRIENTMNRYLLVQYLSPEAVHVL